MVRIVFNYKMAVQKEDDLEQISDVESIKGCTVLSDGMDGFAVYGDGEDELMPDEQLSDTGGDVTYGNRTEGPMHGDD